MREDPGLHADVIAACLDTQYGIRATSIAFLPVGYDPNAAVYEVATRDGATYFLKVRSGHITESSLRVPRALIDHGIRNVLAPLRTRSSSLWCHLDDHGEYSVVLYPFVRGENAIAAGLSDDQWREFGAALRAIHTSGLGDRFRDQLRLETFSLPSAALVCQLMTLIDDSEFESPIAQRFAEFWKSSAGRIRRLLDRAREIGRVLKSRSFELVLCHGDIHAANILVGEDGRIWLVDWDEPIVAPRERDLLFIIGSRIAKAVEPREEDLFFEAYGPTEIDAEALAYYRYERIIEDLGEFGKSVFLDPEIGEQAREEAAELAMSFFAPGSDIDSAEYIPCLRWPRTQLQRERTSR